MINRHINKFTKKMSKFSFPSYLRKKMGSFNSYKEVSLIETRTWTFDVKQYGTQQLI